MKKYHVVYMYKLIYMRVASWYATNDHTDMWLKGGCYDMRGILQDGGALWRRALHVREREQVDHYKV